MYSPSSPYERAFPEKGGVEGVAGGEGKVPRLVVCLAEVVEVVFVEEEEEGCDGAGLEAVVFVVGGGEGFDGGEDGELNFGGELQEAEVVWSTRWSSL